MINVIDHWQGEDPLRLCGIYFPGNRPDNITLIVQKKKKKSWLSESHTAEEVYSARVPSLSAAVGSCWSLHILLAALLTQNTLMTSPLFLPCRTVKSSMFPCEEGRSEEERKGCMSWWLALYKNQWISILHFYTYTVLCYHDTQLVIALYAETSDVSLFRALK